MFRAENFVSFNSKRLNPKVNRNNPAGYLKNMLFRITAFVKTAFYLPQSIGLFAPASDVFSFSSILEIKSNLMCIERSLSILRMVSAEAGVA